LDGGVLRRKVRIDECSYLLRLREIREATMKMNEEPVAVHARVPVEAPIEDRMERARCLKIGFPLEHVIELVRVLVRDVSERDASERGSIDVGEANAHRWNTRRYMRTVLPSRSKRAVGACARMTPFLSGSSRRAAGTTLKLAAMGVISVPQNPESIPSAAIT